MTENRVNSVDHLIASTPVKPTRADRVRIYVETRFKRPLKSSIEAVREYHPLPKLINKTRQGGLLYKTT